MPENDYLVLVDPEEAKKAWETDKGKWEKYVAARYAKKAAKAGVAAVVSHFTFSIGGVIFEAPGLYKTDQHIKRLLEIRDNRPYQCLCEQTITCAPVLNYAIEQKMKKYARRIVKSVPVVGTVAALGTKIGGVTKTDKGGMREKYARMLRDRAKDGCPRAQAIMAELLGSYRSQDSWKEMFSVCLWEEGWGVLKDKMAST